MAWTAPTEVDADALDAVSLPPPQPEVRRSKASFPLSACGALRGSALQRSRSQGRRQSGAPLLELSGRSGASDCPGALFCSQTQEVSIVAVSLPGLSVDTWRTKKSSVPALTDLEGALTVRCRKTRSGGHSIPRMMPSMLRPSLFQCTALMLGLLQTRPPHFLLFVSPSFPLEAFANVLDQASPKTEINSTDG